MMKSSQRQHTISGDHFDRVSFKVYLAKVAMDIVAKKAPPDKDVVRIAELDEMSYRMSCHSMDKSHD